MTKTVWIIEDDLALADLFQEHLSKGHYSIKVFDNPINAIGSLNSSPPDLIITDLAMPSLNGFDLTCAVKEVRPEIPIIVVSVFGGKKNVETAKNMGANGYLVKPFALDDLSEAVGKALSCA